MRWWTTWGLFVEGLRASRKARALSIPRLSTGSPLSAGSPLSSTFWEMARCPRWTILWVAQNRSGPLHRGQWTPWVETFCPCHGGHIGDKSANSDAVGAVQPLRTFRRQFTTTGNCPRRHSQGGRRATLLTNKIEETVGMSKLPRANGCPQCASLSPTFLRLVYSLFPVASPYQLTRNASQSFPVAQARMCDLRQCQTWASAPPAYTAAATSR